MRGRLRLGTAIAATVTVFTASLAYAAAGRLDAPAQVHQPALRLSPPDNQRLTPEQRAAYDMVAIVNLERAERGLPAYVWHDQVGDAAYEHSADMAIHRSLQHAGRDGSNAGLRLTRAGFVWTTWGENIGAGFSEPQPLFTAWFNSPSHRPQLLGDYRYIGVGAVASSDGTPYWTLVVAS